MSSAALDNDDRLQLLEFAQQLRRAAAAERSFVMIAKGGRLNLMTDGYGDDAARAVSQLVVDLLRNAQFALPPGFRVQVCTPSGEAHPIGEAWKGLLEFVNPDEWRGQASADPGPCPDCGGHGADPASDNLNWLPCRTCAGSGRARS